MIDGVTSTTAPTEPSPEEGPATDCQPGEDGSSDHETASHETAGHEAASHEAASHEAASADEEASDVNELAPDVEPAAEDEPTDEPAADVPEAAEQVRDDEQPSAGAANEVKD